MAAKDPFQAVHAALRRDPRGSESREGLGRGSRSQDEGVDRFSATDRRPVGEAGGGSARLRRGGCIRKEGPGTAGAVEVEAYALTAFVYDQCVWMISQRSPERRYTSVQFQRYASSVPPYEM